MFHVNFSGEEYNWYGFQVVFLELCEEMAERLECEGNRVPSSLTLELSFTSHSKESISITMFSPEILFYGEDLRQAFMGADKKDFIHPHSWGATVRLEGIKITSTFE